MHNDSIADVVQMNAKLPPLYLNAGADRRLQQGACWVYSNEVDTKKSPFNHFTAGMQVCVLNAHNKPLGSAYINPHSLICARLYSRRANIVLDEALIATKLQHAFTLRQQYYTAPYYRLCFSEADGLPGLIIDRFDQVIVIMITTAGMEQHKMALLNAISTLLPDAQIILRNDAPIRELEQLSLYTETIGDIPDYLTIIEGEVSFHVPTQSGQKTGWFYDQHRNRDAVIPFLRDKTVLDLFSYVGGWGLRALQAGATAVTCVDASATAITQLLDNAQRNQLSAHLSTIQGDAFEVLKQLKEQHKRFDAIIVDPPAFIKRKKDYKAGFEAYKRINQLAIQLLNPRGLLISMSCSQHLSSTQFDEMIIKACHSANVSGQLLKILKQSEDHPILIGMPETYYLKGLMMQINPLE